MLGITSPDLTLLDKPSLLETFRDGFWYRTNWENYYMEITMIIGIVVYFLNFFTGKTKNQKIANQVKYKSCASCS